MDTNDLTTKEAAEFISHVRAAAHAQREGWTLEEALATYTISEQAVRAALRRGAMLGYKLARDWRVVRDEALRYAVAGVVAPTPEMAQAMWCVSETWRPEHGEGEADG